MSKILQVSSYLSLETTKLGLPIRAATEWAAAAAAQHYRCKARIAKHQHLKIASLPIPDELFMDIFICLPTPADLICVAAGCLSFHNIVADRSFLRRFRKVHTPPLLGFLDDHRVFHPAIPPHPSMSAAHAVAVAADFSSFLPHPTHNWVIKDIRDGRVLLLAIGEKWRLFREMVVCDPLHRRYLLLPPTPEDLVASMEYPHWIEGMCWCETFLLPPDINDKEAEAVEETTFRVVLMAWCKTMMAAFVFSSSTGQWQAIPSLGWNALGVGLLLSSRYLSAVREYMSGCFHWVLYWWKKILVLDNLSAVREYMSGCFHWVLYWWKKILVLDTQRTEFYIVDSPPEAGAFFSITTMVAWEGRPRVFMRGEGGTELKFYTIMRSNGASYSQMILEKTIPVGFVYWFAGSIGRHLFLYDDGSLSPDSGCFSLDIKTFQIERACASKTWISTPRAYSNFPPSLVITNSSKWYSGM